MLEIVLDESVGVLGLRGILEVRFELESVRVRLGLEFASIDLVLDSMEREVGL